MRSAAVPPDGRGVLIVSLGSTTGLREADEELAASLRRAGARVDVALAQRPREVRTLALTDLLWARAARAAAAAALRREPGRAVIYSTTTAALLWPRPGAIRFDAPAAGNRPGRHGVWQRPLERPAPGGGAAAAAAQLRRARGGERRTRGERSRARRAAARGAFGSRRTHA